jgi:hypothetical protein
VFTAEENAQIKQLEDMGCNTRFETTIKEVVGGFIITHQTSYVLNDEVKAATRDQLVASDHYAVSSIIADLYGDLQKDAEPTQEYIPSPLPEPERYVTKDSPTTPDRYRTSSVREYASQVAAKQQGIEREAHTASHVNQPGG